MTIPFQNHFACAFFTFAVSLFCFEGILDAQDDNRRRGREGRDSGFDVIRYLDRADRDKNGVLDSNELGGRLRDYVKELGVDTSRPVPISKIKRSYEDKKQREADDERKKTIDANRQVSKFGTGESMSPPPDFAVAAGSNGRLEDQYPEAMVKNVGSYMERFDENDDGLLDSKESWRVRQMLGDNADSDENGKIDKFELAAALQKRADANSERGRGGRGDRGRGDRGRGDRGRGDRGRGDRDRGNRGNRFSSDGSSENRPQPQSPSGANSRDIRGKPSTKSSSSSSSSTNKPSRSLTARYSSYVDGIINRYDEDGDRKLSAEERKDISGSVKLVDENGDGFVDRNEAINSVAGTAKAATPTAEPKGDSSPSERRKRSRDRDREKEDEDEKSEEREDRGGERSRSRSQSSDIRYDVKGFGNVQIKTEARTDKKTDLERKADRKFLSFDKNTDGRITMGEFRDGRQWTDALVRKFQKLDENADSIVTIEEFEANYSSRDFDD